MTRSVTREVAKLKDGQALGKNTNPKRNQDLDRQDQRSIAGALELDQDLETDRRKNIHIQNVVDLDQERKNHLLMSINLPPEDIDQDLERNRLHEGLDLVRKKKGRERGIHRPHQKHQRLVMQVKNGEIIEIPMYLVRQEEFEEDQDRKYITKTYAYHTSNKIGRLLNIWEEGGGLYFVGSFIITDPRFVISCFVWYLKIQCLLSILQKKPVRLML